MNISATIIAATIATIALASSVFSADRPAVAVAVEGKSDWRIELASKDIPVVQASVVVFSALFVGLNLVVDIVYAYLDPRVRLG